MSALHDLTGLFEDTIATTEGVSPAAKQILSGMVQRSGMVKPVTVVFSARKLTLDLAREVAEAFAHLNTKATELGSPAVFAGQTWSFNSKDDSALVVFYPEGKQDDRLFQTVYDAVAPAAEAPALNEGVA